MSETNEFIEPESREEYLTITVPFYLIERINLHRGYRKDRKPKQHKREPYWFVIHRALDLYEQVKKEE